VTVNDLERLYDYGFWANRKLLVVASQLTPEQFTRPVAGAYGSVRTTLVHTMSAEWAWLERCGGQPRDRRIVAEDFPTVDSLAHVWTKVETYVRAFLAGLTDDDMARRVEFAVPGGGTRVMAMGELLQHGANHGVHHRGQVALLLRMLNRVPGNFDLLFYDAERQNIDTW